uniref:Uncharacterized protein n=1 Tax=Oryza meridionalis TaxID=40149 RepID=A0A0E0BYX0_9ORYZ
MTQATSPLARIPLHHAAPSLIFEPPPTSPSVIFDLHRAAADSFLRRARQLLPRSSSSLPPLHRAAAPSINPNLPQIPVICAAAVVVGSRSSTINLHCHRLIGAIGVAAAVVDRVRTSGVEEMVAVVAGALTTTTTALVGVCARVGRLPPPRVTGGVVGVIVSQRKSPLPRARLWWLKATGCLSSHRTIRGGLLLSFGTNGQSASSIPSPPNIQLYETLSGVLLPSSSLSLHVSKMGASIRNHGSGIAKEDKGERGAILVTAEGTPLKGN